MHTVYRESACCEGGSPPRQLYQSLLAAMYVLSPAIATYLLAAAFRWVPRPEPLGAWMGFSMGAMFTLASIYSATLMIRRPRREATRDERRTRRVMVLLFALLSALFIALTLSFLYGRQLVAEILDHAARAAPVYFLIASVYFENRFAFYDLVVKRATLLLMSIVSLSLYLAATMPWLDRLPAGPARPWLFAVMLAPLGLVMPWLYARSERWLDRIWLGREYTPVEAVKHVLAAMQPATDERSLVAATEARLAEMFGGPAVVLVDGTALPAGSAVEGEVALASPSGGEIRIVVLRTPGTRRVLSEDLALLRSLAGVFGVMLENLRLQQRRQEQEQIAHGLRLQSSRSELKALRAQINPHFLFNALNAIASLIHTDPRRADEVVEQLAEVFRYTLRRSDSEWAPLDQELAFVRAYLDVEQARFGWRLVCAIDSDHGSPPPQVPSMLLQTLVENAVKHGVSQAREAGRIDVVVRTTDGDVTIEVRDTGPGPAASPSRPRGGEGFGLRSVRERLRGHFGDGASFALTRDETAGVTIARITMPHVRVAA
jgi:two-component system LytT family sensor kinase